MAVKDDYVMRMIKDMARVLARLILGKDDINYVLPEDEEFTVIDNLYKKLITMADAGQINEAERISCSMNWKTRARSILRWRHHFIFI